MKTFTVTISNLKNQPLGTMTIMAESAEYAEKFVAAIDGTNATFYKYVACEK